MSERWRNWTCGRCGAEAEFGDDEGGWAMCADCEADYQRSLAAEYPHGQCQTCGAAYYVHTRRDGSTEYRANHAEGQCPNWVDWADVDHCPACLEMTEDCTCATPEPTEAAQVQANSDAWGALLQAYSDKLRAAAGADREPF